MLATGGTANDLVWYESDLVDPAGVEHGASAGLANGHLAVRPNPVRGQAGVSFELPADAELVLDLYAADGTLVRCLAAGAWPAGRHRVTWDRRDALGNQVPQGFYFCRLRAGSATLTRRLVCVR